MATCFAHGSHLGSHHYWRRPPRCIRSHNLPTGGAVAPIDALRLAILSGFPGSCCRLAQPLDAYRQFSSPSCFGPHLASFGNDPGCRLQLNRWRCAMSAGPNTSNAAPLSTRLAWIGRKLMPLGLFLAAGVLLIVLVGLAQRLGWLRAEGGTATSSAAAPARSTPARCIRRFASQRRAAVRFAAWNWCPLRAPAARPGRVRGEDRAGPAAAGQHSDRQSRKRPR